MYQAEIKDILTDEYPPEEKTQRAPWMSDNTFAICERRSKAWTYLNVVGRKIANGTCWFVFRWIAWTARVKKKPSWCATRGPVMKELCLRWVYESNRLGDLTDAADEAMADDLSRYAADRADQLENASLNNDSRLVNQIIRSYRKKMPMAQERLLDANGKHAESYTEERDIVRSHFQGSLKGSVVALSDLLQAERDEAVSRAVKNADAVRQFESVPNRQQIMQRHCKAPMYTANGESNIGPEVHKCWPEAMTRGS